MLNFFKIFESNSEEEVRRYSKLFGILQAEYEQLKEEELLVISCIAGLFARVAYVDFKLDKNEVEKMRDLLRRFNLASVVNSEIVIDLAVEHIKEMAGLENHLYVHPLNSYLSKDERFKILQFLFLIAASDGSVEGVETEEIRIIAKGLELSTQHFLAARAEVAQYLKSLKF